MAAVGRRPSSDLDHIHETPETPSPTSADAAAAETADASSTTIPPQEAALQGIRRQLAVVVSEMATLIHGITDASQAAHDRTLQLPAAQKKLAGAIVEQKIKDIEVAQAELSSLESSIAGHSDSAKAADSALVDKEKAHCQLLEDEKSTLDGHLRGLQKQRQKELDACAGFVKIQTKFLTDREKHVSIY